MNDHIPYVVEHHLHSLYAITQPACTTRLCKVKSGYKTFWPFPSRGLNIFSTSPEFVAPSPPPSIMTTPLHTDQLNDSGEV